MMLFMGFLSDNVIIIFVKLTGNAEFFYQFIKKTQT